MSNEPPRPIELARSGAELVIRWSDGQRRVYAPAELRGACPCATCRADPWQATAGGAPAIESMSPVGNYAYRIAFSDGHSTGIYTLELLRQMGAGGEERKDERRRMRGRR